MHCKISRENVELLILLSPGAFNQSGGGLQYSRPNNARTKFSRKLVLAPPSPLLPLNNKKSYKKDQTSWPSKRQQAQMWA
jgi:hypothetical protein